MAIEGGVSHGYPTGAGGKEAASSSARSFLFSLCMLPGVLLTLPLWSCHLPNCRTFDGSPSPSGENIRSSPGLPRPHQAAHPSLRTHRTA